jgi:hypothetical protein
MIKFADKGTAFGGGFINGRLDDPDLQETLWSYKRRVAGNYRPLAPEEIGLLPSGRYLVSEKLDGELWFLVASKGTASLVNPYGRVIHGGIPLLTEASALTDGTILAGELYIQKEESRSRVGDLSAYFANPNLSPERSLAFCVFDVVQGHDGVEQESYELRYGAIKALLQGGQSLHAVAHSELASAAEISSAFAERVLGGHAEGLIVRTSSGLIYKLKPVIELDALVVAYTSRVDSPDQARSLLLALAQDDETFQIVGGCGNLGTDENRLSLFKQLKPFDCNSAVRVSSDTGGLYQFVKPSLIVQVKVTDLQADRADGSPSLGHQIKLGEKGWGSIGMYPTARLIHPVLMRVREDKAVNSHDLRISQIDSYVSISRVTSLGASLSAKSEVLRRELWVKEAKGVKAVRKLLVWKTNKETITTSMPAFVIHWTDYSPGRASPLDREVKLAPTQAIATAIADRLIEENIKKGWERV